MNRRHWAHLVVVAVAAAAFAVAAPASASSLAADDAAAAATGYLGARAAALTAADPAATLAAWIAPGSALVSAEAQVARGAVIRGRGLGRTAEAADCAVTIVASTIAADGRTAVVKAHAITTVTWREPGGGTDAEASGVDHKVALALSDDGWRVTADAYADVTRPGCLEAAGASPQRVRAASRALERASSPVRLPRATRQPAAIPARRYRDILVYDRDKARDYADDYALSYNPTWVRFSGADCANFASQCGRAGGMPLTASTASPGWWYDKNGTSSPGDDTYSLSWINVTKQIGYWNGRRTEWETSIGQLARGDFVYYDWGGDGVWDHVAVVAGVNSAGQKVIDAHTTDHYRVYWKLGSSGTKYRYARTWTQWIV